MTRADIVLSARECLETPWVHRGRSPGSELDCVGMLVHVCKTYEIPHKDCHAYSRLPDGVLFREHLDRNLIRIMKHEMGIGDIPVFSFTTKRWDTHAGIIGNYHSGGFSLIHTYRGVGKVCEHFLTMKWKNRISLVYRFPGLEV